MVVRCDAASAGESDLVGLLFCCHGNRGAQRENYAISSRRCLLRVSERMCLVFLLLLLLFLTVITADPSLSLMFHLPVFLLSHSYRVKGFLAPGQSEEHSVSFSSGAPSIQPLAFSLQLIPPQARPPGSRSPKFTRKLKSALGSIVSD